MASTVLPNGIIIPEKYSRDWYNDLYHNWQELDNLLGGGGGGANDGTLTIQKNGTTVGTFSANQATDETIDITVPTKTSDLNNDSGFITGVAWDDVTNKPSFATVATSGSYTDLSDKPTIPTVNNATLTIQQNGTTVDTFTANSSTDKTVDITVPTKTSDLTNDSGFITSDNTKIPLAGSNQISGDLIPATDNSIDVGSSSKNIKMLYTKGITIDGKTIDTDANGNMTYDGHIVDTVEEQGTGYIRYSNGLQICWGTITWQSACSSSWGAVYDTAPANETYAESFIEAPHVSACSISSEYAMLETTGGNNTRTPNFSLCRGTAINEITNWGISYIAIGRWK